MMAKMNPKSEEFLDSEVHNLGERVRFSRARTVLNHACIKSQVLKYKTPFLKDGGLDLRFEVEVEREWW